MFMPGFSLLMERRALGIVSGYKHLTPLERKQKRVAAGKETEFNLLPYATLVCPAITRLFYLTRHLPSLPVTPGLRQAARPGHEMASS